VVHFGRRPIAVLLIVALAAILTGCSPSEAGRPLPSAVEGGEFLLSHIGCSLNGSGTEATATGKFPVPVAYIPGLVPPAGHGGFTLRFYVYGDNQEIGNQDLLGFASEAIRPHSTTWHTQASVRTGMRPTDCIFQFNQNSL
jgi:hypothetical protein